MRELLKKASVNKFIAATVITFAAAFCTFAQDGLPEPGPAKPIAIPAVKETKLKNGLTVAVVEKRNVPIVTVQLLVKTGSFFEDADKAGLADMTASMLTKGTKTRSATQIAEEMEFLGGSINSGASWNHSSITMSITSDKLNQAMAILADVALNPTFPQSEIDLLRSQAIDGLSYNLTQPGPLSNYVASAYAFSEHPAGGTVASLSAITQKDIQEFYKDAFLPGDAVLIFAGDITPAAANTLATRMFKNWKQPKFERKEIIVTMMEAPPETPEVSSSPAVPPVVTEILIVDLPDSGQASVSYVQPVNKGRAADRVEEGANADYYVASTLNSVLGGGYSSRLNQEIRIKRGLSYGAGSGFAWRWDKTNFSTRTQTKNESAPEVAEIVVKEVQRLADGEITASELDPRKAVLTGGFGQTIETTAGIVGALSELYTFGIAASELNAYSNGINRVSAQQIKVFAKANLLGGKIIIVGDHAKFKDDLAKRFPSVPVEVVKATELDITEPDLKKKQ
ncbi:MAG: pitrilysin family protein [Pyrinomonadaceae bacterium]|nr:pitrilysin family protein [Pyrinomonadaceae bacterium]